MDMYTDNNGFQVIEGATPFDEDAQFQETDSLPVAPYQETAAETAWYGGTDSAESLPVETYQETVMENAWYDGTNGTEELPAAAYQETAEYPAAAYQEIAEYGDGTYLEEADTLPVEPGQIEMPETEDPGLYQVAEPVPEGADMGQEEILPAADEPGPAAESEADEPGQSETPETAETETALADLVEDDEKTKRARHEAAEAERKAEWEARQQQKKDALKKQQEELDGMSDEEIVEKSMKRINVDTEKLTRRNMKECVAEYIQTLCLEDIAFARMTMDPKKSMLHCFEYINHKAWDYVQDEMKVNGIKPGTGQQGYGCDIPDDLCYQWAEDYFRNPLAKEDEEEEEKFVPKPYVGKSGSKSTAKKKTEKQEKKATEKKTPKKSPETEKKAGDIEMTGQLSLLDMMAQQNKAS